jgi:hypothetical protein
MNVRGYQHLPSAPPALSACIYCRTPVLPPFRPLPCGCFLPLHTQCHDTIVISEVGCPACRTYWVAGIASSATSVTSAAETSAARSNGVGPNGVGPNGVGPIVPWPSEGRPSPSCVSCECSPWWSVYVIGILIIGIGILYILFHYIIE